MKRAKMTAGYNVQAFTRYDSDGRRTLEKQTRRETWEEVVALMTRWEAEGFVIEVTEL